MCVCSKTHYAPSSPVHVYPCTCTEMTSCFHADLSFSFLGLIIALFFQTGQWSSPGGVSHQKETGLSAEGVPDRRQGRYRQFQHPSAAAGHAPGSTEEPAAGTSLRQCVQLHVEQSNTRQQMKSRKRREGG